MVPGESPALREGIRLFNGGEFFACHEVWEEEWRSARPPARLFLQALIHLAVAFHHRQQGNPAGEERQLGKGLKKLAGYLPEYSGIDTGALYHACVRFRSGHTAKAGAPAGAEDGSDGGHAGSGRPPIAVPRVDGPGAGAAFVRESNGGDPARGADASASGAAAGFPRIALRR